MECPVCLLSLGLSSDRPGQKRSSADEIGRDGVLPRFGNYELLSEIARGGMGVVYRARQTGLDRLVAVKLILAGQLATRESVERFRREAQTASQLHHPGIVPIYEIGEFETQHFYSMELIDGESLADCMSELTVTPGISDSDRSVREADAALLISKVARALEFAHQRGVLHRDVKPSNILIDQDGEPRLTDFGLAKLTGAIDGGLTLTQAVLGTPGYVSPEQAAGSADVTIASDIYGLGAILYELLTGRPPFAGANAVETLWMAVHNEPVSPGKLNPTVNRDLETIALHCLEKKPQNRYSTAAEVADELQRFLRREPIMARPVGSLEQFVRWCQRNRRVAVLAGSLLGLFVAGSVLVSWQWVRAERANIKLTENVADLRWTTISNMISNGQSSRGLAIVASILEQNPSDGKAAMFGLSLVEQHRFPVPAAPAIRHPDGAELTVARLSPDGTRIATASFDGTARIWDARSSRQLGPALQHASTVNWIEFSSDGKMLVTASADRTVCLWDALTGQSILPKIEEDAGVTSANFSSDDRHILVRTQKAAAIYNLQGQKIWDARFDDGKLISVRFLSNGQRVFLAHQGKQQTKIQIHETRTGELSHAFEMPRMNHADISEDGSRVVTISGAKVFSWDPGNGELLREVLAKEHASLVDVKVNSNGSQYAILSTDQWIRVWDTESGIPVTPELEHEYLIRGFEFVNNSESLLSWSDDATVRLWRISESDSANAGSRKVDVDPMRHSQRVIHAELGRLDARDVCLATLSHLKSRTSETRTGSVQLWKIPRPTADLDRGFGIDPGGFDSAVLSRDGRLLAIAKTDSTLWIQETATGENLCAPIAIEGGVWGMAFVPDGSLLVTAGTRGHVSRWSVPGGQLVGTPVKLKTTFQPLEISHDGRCFVTGSTDGFARCWSTETGQILWESKHGSEINAVAISNDGRWIASAGEDRVVRVWHRVTGELRLELKGHTNEVMRVLFSPDDRWIGTASLDSTGRIWDAVSGQERHQLPHQGEVTDIDFSPDGRLVATGSRDRTAMIWTVATGRPTVSSLLHTQALRDVRFSPDGMRLLALDFHGPRLWDVATGHPLTIPLPHRTLAGIGFKSTSQGPQFTPDGNRFLVAHASLEARIWEAKVPPSETPEWFPELLEAIAGQKFIEEMELPVRTDPSTFLNLRDRILQSNDADFYTQWARRWLGE